MTSATISATADLDEEILVELCAKIARDLSVAVDESRVFLRSAEPPSWITLIAQSDWWVKGLAAYPALYVAELVKEAAKDTWESKGKIVAAIVGSGNALFRLASSLLTARAKSRADTYVSIGLPIPDDVYTTLLRLESKGSQELALETALFVHHVPSLVRVLEEARVPNGSAVGWVTTELLEDGSLRVEWLDKASLQHREVLLPLHLSENSDSHTHEP